MEKMVSIQRGDLTISGTLEVPEKKEQSYPAVLIISGSGPLNRDGNGKRGQVFNLYNSLAAFFKENGFVTLRYDKRGVGASTGTYLEAGLWDLIDDAKAVLRFLKEQPEVDPHHVFVIGHSEGAMIAPALAKDEELAGVILLSGAAETMAEALAYQRGQAVRSLKEISGIKGKLLNVLKVPERAEKQGPKFDEKMIRSESATVRVQGMKMNAKWFQQHYQFNARKVLEEVDCPILAVTGSKDVQVTPERVFEVERYAPGEVEAKIIPNMNHMLRDQTEDYSILQLKKAYKQAGSKPLSGKLLTTMKEWLVKYV
ncbi:alpha/beta hydrolase [Alkalihalophilus marmarensis]|uniref:Serine aminopeptidase S33 domain-containing protein n=1 Tax=Alkalihalophilus marmarensis DSM 21297 TaxID=1188261 RepID=U6SI45_9BACI|nr:alpha/beta hydrolase [Alkalihalophilus marmarensis]ERN51369.1 hypothetical protein A33I_01465 [Alkalihalophilus marmarensis DSM 21297]MCM3490416.1 alpha/beta hydrolase [Alkalihalophilus marmarensis]